MPVLYPHAQDRPMLDPKQLPIQINAPVSPEKGGAGLDGLISDEDGRGQAQEAIGSALRAATDDDIMSKLSAFREQNPFVSTLERGGLLTLSPSDSFLQPQRQASGGGSVEVPAMQAPVSMEKALPSDAEVVVEMNEGGLVGQGQIRYPHTEAANALMGQVPNAGMGEASDATLSAFREQNPFVSTLERSGLVNLSLPQYPSAMTNYIPETFGGGVFGSAMDLALSPQSDGINDFIREGMGRNYDAAKEARRLEREQAQMVPVAPVQEVPMPAQEAPMMQALPGDAGAAVAMKNGGLVKQAQKVQGKGRYGDSMLVHMNPQEYQAMASLGGLGGLSANQVTINPDTGLPEMFSFKDILPTIVGLAASPFVGPMGVALATGATTAITTGDIGKGLMAGLGSYALGSLADSFGSSAASQGIDAATASATNAPVTALDAGLTPDQVTAFGQTGAPLRPEAATNLVGGYPSTSPSLSLTQPNTLLAPPGYGGAPNLPANFSSSPAIGTSSLGRGEGISFNQGLGSQPTNFIGESLSMGPDPSAFNMSTAGQPAAPTVSGLANDPAAIAPVQGANLVPQSPPPSPSLTGGALARSNMPPPSMLPLDDAGRLTEAGARAQARSSVDALSPLRIDSGVEYDMEGLAKGVTGLKPDAAASAINKDLGQQIYRGSPYFNTGGADTATRFDMLGEGISNIGEEGFPGYFQTAAKGVTGLGGMAAGAGFFDPEPLDYAAIPGRRIYQKPDIQPLNRAVNLEGFDAAKTGIDPQFSFFAKNGKRGGLDTIHAQTGYSDISMAQMGRPAQGQGAMTQQGTPQTAQMRSAIMKAAQEVASNANPRAATGPAPRAVGLNPNAAVNALFSSNQNVRMQEGGVPSEAMMAQEGIMEVASEEVKDNLNERMSVTPDVSQPQNVEERSVYDRAMLAVQGMLEPEEAQMAIEEFIETFGPEAYNMISELARNPRDEGGVIKPANGGTTIANGAMQGEDIIAGKIVDPDTGEETANLRVGENEYIEPADSLSRRAMAAGLPGTPENGARVRGMEEEQLRQAFG